MLIFANEYQINIVNIFFGKYESFYADFLRRIAQHTYNLHIH